MDFNCDDANMIAYVPVYCCVNEVPEAFRRENNVSNEFSERSAFWVNNLVANMIYPRYAAMIGDLVRHSRSWRTTMLPIRLQVP